MPNNLEKNNSNSDNDDEHETETESDSESNNTTLNGVDDTSDDEEYFVRFNSMTNYDHIDYVMIGSTCYELADNSEDSTNNNCLFCQHDVLVYFINGYVEQSLMDKPKIRDLCRLQEINIYSHDIFQHLHLLE